MADPAKIVVATDFSPSSDEAIRQADRWARETDARLVACHVVPVYVEIAPLFPQVHESDAEVVVGLERVASERLVERVRALTGRDPTEFDTIVDSGAPDASIVEVAEHARAELLVIGAHGETSMPRLMLGRVARRVLSYAHSAVLVARPSPRGGHVLAGTDVSEPSLPALSLAAEIARRTGSRLTVLHAVEPPRRPIGRGAPSHEGLTAAERAELEGAVRGVVGRLGEQADTVVAEGPAAARIVEAAERLPADLVVVATRGHTGLRRLAIGSVALAVAQAAPCSVLALRRP